MPDLSCLTTLPSLPPAIELPKRFPSPFNNRPHPLAKWAGDMLQARLLESTALEHDFHAPEGGKMFGVLVVRNSAGVLGYLSAFSGMLGGRWCVPGFVSPLFDLDQRRHFLPKGEQRLADYGAQIEALTHSSKRAGLLAEIAQLSQQREAEEGALKSRHRACKALRHQQRKRSSGGAALLARLAAESQRDKRERREWAAQWRQTLASVQAQLAEIDGQISTLKRARTALSNRLHRALFSGYCLSNWRAEQIALSDCFDEGRPPGGAGDCAGPKLIHYACQYNLVPLALAEFWWGAAPKERVRQHGRYYPACRGKCRPILPFMLGGLEVAAPPLLGQGIAADAPEVVYEDDDLVVVDKPHGLLSVPGREVKDSVLTRMQQRYPDASGPLLVHRLDLSTSGLLLVAKRAVIHKALQQQFIQRTIGKRYVAILSKVLPKGVDGGEVDLPLRVDFDDRPRQLVCYHHGKAARTRWQVVARGAGVTRVFFYPETGRTHQLRLHAAHPQGLDAPIKGDELYGDGDGRLRLHAERLSFTHPQTGRRLTLCSVVPF